MPAFYLRPCTQLRSAGRSKEFSAASSIAVLCCAKRGKDRKGKGMLRVRMVLLAVVEVLFISRVVTTCAQGVDRWGADVRGIQVAVRLSDGRGEYHPGEILNWLVLVKHAGTMALHLPWNEGGNHVTVHVRTADGQECVYLPPITKTAHQWRSSMGSGGWVAKHASWRLTETSSYGWVDAKKPDAPVSVSLRKPGTYRMWAEYEVVAAKDAPANAWEGKAVSGVVEWTVAELPVARRNLGLTAQQESDVRDWLAVEPGNARSVVWDRMYKDLTWAENEGLAMRLAAIVSSEPKHALEGMYLLRHRSGEANEIGIDGPYLKEAANAVLLVGEGRYAVERPFFNNFNQYSLVAVYLRLHPDDVEMRDRVVALAKSYCKLSEDGTWLRPASENETAGMPLATAWNFLLQTGVLYEGMPIDEATELLGKPTRQDKQGISWVLKSQSRAITMVGATHDGEKIVTWHARR